MCVLTAIRSVRILAGMEKVINIWPKITDLAEDLGLPYTTVHSWAARGSIPARYDLQLVAAAEKRGSALSLEELAKMRAKTSEAKQ